MREATSLIVGTWVSQAAGGLILAALLAAFWNHYRRLYLAHWSLSWVSLSVYHLTAAAGLAMTGIVSPLSSSRIALAVISGVAGYLQLAWLLMGVRELATGRRFQRARVALLFGIAVLIGIIAGASFTTDPTAFRERFVMRVALRALIAGIVFLIAAAGVWSIRNRTSRTGVLLITGAFGLYGVGQLTYVAMSLIDMFGTGESLLNTIAPWIGFVDFTLQSVMGLGMITVLLEDERERVILANDEMQYLAYHDSLTGLPNRPLFIDRLLLATRSAVRHKDQIAVLFCDLDRFKEINDSLGHTQGDELLRTVARRIRSVVRSEDTVARFGGDEFTLIVDRIESPEDAATIASKILDAVREPMMVGGHELFATISIGVSIFPGDGRDAETLVRNADTAMYRAKEQGRDGFQLYAPEMNARALERLALANALRRALSQGELRVFYQPLVDVPSGLVSSFEALVRWQHPDRGLLTPGSFIDAAEESGLIVPIGEWVLRTACVQLPQIQRAIGRPVAVSVNLSSRQFQQSDLVDRVREAIAAGGIEPGRLTLEVTETNAMQNAQESTRTLRELRGLGVSVSLDDFGTGYSSLSYLKRFPIDTLKLDQSFVRDLEQDPEDEAIASAVLAMARTLGLRVVAEGVETEGQLAFLTQRGCDVVQGFLFSPPVPLEEVERRTQEWNEPRLGRDGIQAV